MRAETGPGGETEAGKIVADNVEKRAQTKQQPGNVRHAQEVLSQRFDEELFEEFKQKRKVLRRKIRKQRSGRWIMRTTLVGGALVVTVLTLGLGASAFAFEPAYEKAVRGKRRAAKKAKEDLKADFVRRSKDGDQLKQTNPDWFWDNKVQRLEDLGGSYSLESGSSDSDILHVVRRGERLLGSQAWGARRLLRMPLLWPFPRARIFRTLVLRGNEEPDRSSGLGREGPW